MEAHIVLDGREHVVRLEEVDGLWFADVDGDRFPVRTDRRGLRAAVTVGGDLHLVDTTDPHEARIDGHAAPYRIVSLSGVAGVSDAAAGAHGPVHPPMTGKLDTVLVRPGQDVIAGEVLFVLEAMKMRNEVKAAADGTVTEVLAQAGQAVDTHTHILTLSPKDS